jgi:hypothetical protein
MAALEHERHDTTRHDTTRHDTTRHDTTRHDTTRHDTTRHDTFKVRLASRWTRPRSVNHYPYAPHANVTHLCVVHVVRGEDTSREHIGAQLDALR